MNPLRLGQPAATLAPGIAVAGLMATALLTSACRGPGGPGARDQAGGWQVELATLEKVLPGTFEDMHWGRLNIRCEAEGLTAAALTPDGRTVEISAKPTARGTTAIHVRAGRFGDRKLEEAFLDTLERRVHHWRQRHPPDKTTAP